MRPDRYQLRFVPVNLDSLVDEDHRVRSVWSMVEKVDVSQFEAKIAARGEKAGRAAIDPRILVCLWLYGTLEGVAHGRELARLCEQHHAYRWICGGVGVNHHTLSDFRVGHEKALDELMTQVLAVLMHQGMVDLDRVAQDGMRVRASAGSSSFRREPSLEKCLEEARQHVEEIKQEKPDGTLEARKAARRASAAQERVRRVERALAELPQLQNGKKAAEKPKARVSTTDPEARVMKMADGGFRPAYNAQFATDTKTRVIVGVDVTNVGSDRSQMPPMLQNIQKRNGRLPGEHLVDGGFFKKEAIEEATRQGVTVYLPLQKPKVEGVDPREPKPGDSAEIAGWRQRMGTEESKEIYRERAATAETVNADLRTHRALDRLQVRTIPKVRCVILWAALAYNVLRLINA
jgi:transposase